MHAGLEFPDFLSARPAQIIDAICQSLSLVFPERGQFLGGSRENQLAQTAMLNALLPDVLVQQFSTGHAQTRLERARRVINAGMDDFRVSAADPGTDCPLGLQHQYLAT